MAKKNRLTREQAAEIYDQLRTTMEKRYGKEGLQSLMDKEKAMAGVSKQAAMPRGGLPEMPTSSSISSRPARRAFAARGNAGVRAAFALVICVAGLKTGLSAIEASGMADMPTAEASMQAFLTPRAPQSFQQFSRDELQLLKTLDARRVELEQRSDRLQSREQEISQKDRELAARLTELRELTQQLQGERKKADVKQSAQLDQLANVYGSMAPTESARLIEQLDTQISLRLLERMPEKRIAQILAVMSPERALTITRMLSGSRK